MKDVDIKFLRLIKEVKAHGAFENNQYQKTICTLYRYGLIDLIAEEVYVEDKKYADYVVIITENGKEYLKVLDEL